MKYRQILYILLFDYQSGSNIENHGLLLRAVLAAVVRHADLIGVDKLRGLDRGEIRAGGRVMSLEL